jgi:hypothetical protein
VGVTLEAVETAAAAVTSRVRKVLEATADFAGAVAEAVADNAGDIIGALLDGL